MSEQMEQFKAILDDLGHVGARHETARGFYLSVATALLALLALADKDKVLVGRGGDLVRVVGVSGMAISCLWFFQTLSLAALYSARFRSLECIEDQLPFQTFKAQYALLKKDWRFVPITYIECTVAVVFFGVFVVVAFLKPS